MKIVLKQDWDIPIQPPHQRNQKKIGHFVGRDDEVSHLVDEITRKNQGAFLVCGYRGVGKTSFVYKTLNSLRIL
jgi:ATP-dependent Clp protease ATP-binding subunit ClpA